MHADNNTTMDERTRASRVLEIAAQLNEALESVPIGGEVTRPRKPKRKGLAPETHRQRSHGGLWFTLSGTSVAERQAARATAGVPS